MLGYPEAARADCDQAFKEAHEVDLAGSQLWALGGAFFIDILCGDYAKANARIDECVALADEKNAAWWKAFATLGRGWLLSQTGRASDAVQVMTGGITAMRLTQTTLWTPFFLSILARAYADLGQSEEAWRFISEPMGMLETTKEKWCEAEINRIAGEIARMPPDSDAAKAEAYFEQSLAVARLQEAKSWELHAATSLARLWRDEGKRAEARDLLAPIYHWFTEGFDTPVLQDAKALLDELA